MTMVSLQSLNAADKSGFVAALGDTYEHAPWVAEAVIGRRPFATLTALHEAMTAAVRAASADQRLALIKGHPDLAGKAARAGTMTSDSKAEQASAGLDRLSDAEFKEFHRLNNAYREKFKFPFIVCVRRHSKDSILREFARRLQHNAAAETKASLTEVFRGAAPRPEGRRLRQAQGARTALHPRARYPCRPSGRGRGDQTPGDRRPWRAARDHERHHQSRRSQRPAADRRAADPDRALRAALPRRRLFHAPRRAAQRPAVPRRGAGRFCGGRARGSLPRAAIGHALELLHLPGQLIISTELTWE